MAFIEAIWQVVGDLKETEAVPLILALVGGRRRTLTVNMATAFQLLARPEDKLVDVRLDPRSADDPKTDFFFPTQRCACAVQDQDGGLVPASQVQVHLIDMRVPRLRHLLRRADLTTFAEARESLAHAHNLQVYADVMSHFASGERYINRVWSASADGYVDECMTYLDKAQVQFAEALQIVSGLDAPATLRQR